MPRQKNPWPFESFHARYDRLIMPEPNTGCLIWLGAISPTSGYGKVFRLGRWMQTHRCAYMAKHGEIDSAITVRHTCDLKLCVNWDHVIRGTAQDNSDDAVARGLIPFGEHSGVAKLTEEKVRAIRAASGSQREIAAGFGVSQSHVSAVRCGIYWRRLK